MDDSSAELPVRMADVGHQDSPYHIPRVSLGGNHMFLARNPAILGFTLSSRDDGRGTGEHVQLTDSDMGGKGAARQRRSAQRRRRVPVRRPTHPAAPHP